MRLLFLAPLRGLTWRAVLTTAWLTGKAAKELRARNARYPHCRWVATPRPSYSGIFFPPRARRGKAAKTCCTTSRKEGSSRPT